MHELNLDEINPDGAIAETHAAVEGDTRMSFLRKAGLGGAAVSGGVVLGTLGTGVAAAAGPGRPPRAFGKGDIGILDYALTLGYLEAASSDEATASGAITDPTVAALKVVTADENAQVKFLRKALGRKAIKKPTFDCKGTNRDPELFKAPRRERQGHPQGRRRHGLHRLLATLPVHPAAAPGGVHHEVPAAPALPRVCSRARVGSLHERSRTMTDILSETGASVDRVFADQPAATRRRFVAGVAGVLGSMGALGAADAHAQGARPATHERGHEGPNTPRNILAVAATAEALATIINTVGAERVPLDPVTLGNIQAAARHELIHYQVLTSEAVGARPVTTRFWIPDVFFSTQPNFLTRVVVGDTIFVNAYLLATTVFARPNGAASPRLARIASEFMAVESVHRALALQSLGRLGNDRAFAKFAQREEVPGLPISGQPGFYDINQAVTILQGAGIGFGEQGAAPGAFYELGEVSPRTPDPAGVNIRTPS